MIASRVHFFITAADNSTTSALGIRCPVKVCVFQLLCSRGKSGKHAPDIISQNHRFMDFKKQFWKHGSLRFAETPLSGFV